jgi:hypothetical protein
MTPDQIALARRAVACPGWRFPERAFRSNHTKGSACRDLRWVDVAPVGSPDHDWLPDLTDPATLGYLLDLVREAWADPKLHVLPFWRVRRGYLPLEQDGPFVSAPSEAAALVDALEAAPRRSA